MSQSEAIMRQETFPAWVRQFLLSVTIFLLLLSVPYFLRPVARVLLAIFAGVLLAVFLDGGAALLRRIVPIPRGIALTIVILLIFLALAGLLWVGGAQVAAQAAGLTERLPAAVETVRSYVEKSEWLNRLYSWLSQGSGGTGEILGNINTVFSSTFEVFAHVAIILFTGIYVALIRPFTAMPYWGCYRPRDAPEGRGVGGRVMRYWLVGRMVEMAVVGLLTGVGLLLVGAPLALILGVITGLLSFIPFLGPVLSAVPAILVGLTEGPEVALWVLLVFAIVQLVEGNLITPPIERRAVKSGLCCRRAVPHGGSPGILRGPAGHSPARPLHGSRTDALHSGCFGRAGPALGDSRLRAPGLAKGLPYVFFKNGGRQLGQEGVLDRSKRIRGEVLREHRGGCPLNRHAPLAVCEALNDCHLLAPLKLGHAA